MSGIRKHDPTIRNRSVMDSTSPFTGLDSPGYVNTSLSGLRLKPLDLSSLDFPNNNYNDMYSYGNGGTPFARDYVNEDLLPKGSVWDSKTNTYIVKDSSSDGIFSKDGVGWQGLSLASDIFGGFNAYNANKINKDSLNFQKDAFNQQMVMAKEEIARKRADTEARRRAYLGDTKYNNLYNYGN